VISLLFGAKGVVRLYGPLEGYFDKTWPLPDIEKVQ
jgi:hypothetical protein